MARVLANWDWKWEGVEVGLGEILSLISFDSTCLIFSSSLTSLALVHFSVLLQIFTSTSFSLIFNLVDDLITL